MDSISRTVEITILSAENLRLDGKPVKKDAVAVVKPDPLNSRSTRPDHDGGSNPRWNQKLEIEIPSSSRSVTVQIESGSRVIGSAAIPVSDFSGGYFPANYLHMLSYRLRDGRGAKNGIVNVSVRVKGLADYVIPPPVRKSTPANYGGGYSSSSLYCSEPRWGAPAKGNGYGGGVAAGVPIWCGTGA